MSQVRNIVIGWHPKVIVQDIELVTSHDGSPAELGHEVAEYTDNGRILYVNHRFHKDLLSKSWATVKNVCEVEARWLAHDMRPVMQEQLAEMLNVAVML